MQLSKLLPLYTVTNVLNAAIPFLILPILTRYLSPTDYGVLSVVQFFLMLILPVTLSGIQTSIYVEYFKIDTAEIPGYLSSLLIIPVAATIALTLVLLFTQGFFSRQFDIPGHLLPVLPFLAFLQVVPTVLFVLLQAQNRPLSFVQYKLSLTILDVMLSLFFIIVLGMTWSGRLWGSYVAFLLITVQGVYFLYKSGFLVRGIKKEYIRNALIFGLPLIPHEIGGSLLNMSDRVFISKMSGMDAVGIYSIGYQIGMIMSFIATCFNQAWVPYLFFNLKDPTKEIRNKLVRYSYLYMASLFLFLGLLYAATPLIFRLFIDPKYAAAIEYVRWVALGYTFFGLYIAIVNYIFFAKKTLVLAYITVGTGILKLLLNYLFMNYYGTIGAAYATVVSFFVLFMITWWLSNRIYPMPWFSFSTKSSPAP